MKPSSIKPSGVITITTDFGHKGPFAAVMKGVILARYPAARVIDLAHDIPAQWPPEAGFWVSRSFQWFPAGSVHVAIVDPGRWHGKGHSRRRARRARVHGARQRAPRAVTR